MSPDLVDLFALLERYPVIGHALELATIGVLWLVYRSGKQGRAGLHARLDKVAEDLQQHVNDDAGRWATVETTLKYLERDVRSRRGED